MKKQCSVLSIMLVTQLSPVVAEDGVTMEIKEPVESVIRRDDIKDLKRIRDEQAKSGINDEISPSLVALSKNWHPDKFSEKVKLYIQANPGGEVVSVRLWGTNAPPSPQTEELISAVKKTIFWQHSFFLTVDNESAQQCRKRFLNLQKLLNAI